MKSTILILLISFSVSSALASKFQINYKNLNSLAYIVCDEASKITHTKDSFVIHKFEINIEQSDSKGHHDYEVSGKCSLPYSTKLREVVGHGEDLQLKINSQKSSIITGTVGLYNITINTVQNSLVFTHQFADEKIQKNFKPKSWGVTSFLSKDKLAIDLSSGSLIESGNKINFKSQSSQLKATLLNAWTYESIACKASNYNTLDGHCQIEALNKII